MVYLCKNTITARQQIDSIFPHRPLQDGSKTRIKVIVPGLAGKINICPVFLLTQKVGEVWLDKPISHKARIVCWVALFDMRQTEARITRYTINQGARPMDGEGLGTMLALYKLKWGDFKSNRWSACISGGKPCVPFSQEIL